MSHFDLGYNFSHSSGIDEQDMALKRQWLKFFADMNRMDPVSLDNCLVRVRDTLYELYNEADWKIKLDVDNQGFLSTNRSAYCYGAKVLIHLLVKDYQTKIAGMELRQAEYAAHSINLAEQAFEQLSPYHEKVLDNMRSMPN